MIGLGALEIPYAKFKIYSQAEIKQTLSRSIMYSLYYKAEEKNRFFFILILLEVVLRQSWGTTKTIASNMADAFLNILRSIFH